MEKTFQIPSQHPDSQHLLSSPLLVREDGAAPTIPTDNLYRFMFN